LILFLHLETLTNLNVVLF